MSVCPFGLMEFYGEDIIECKLCNMLQLKSVFRKYCMESSMAFLRSRYHNIEKYTKIGFLPMFKLIVP